MRATARTVPLSLALAMVAGCAFATTRLWPKTHHHRRVAVSEPLTVRGNVPGAVVTTPDGKTVLGPSPHQLAARFEVEQRWTTKPLAVWIVAAVASLGVTGFSVYKLATTDSKTPWVVASSVSILDALFTGYDTARRHQQNERARPRARTEIVDATHAFALRWPGFDPVAVTARVPREREVIGRRPARVSFEQAALYWERTAPRPVAGEALVGLSAVLVERAERAGDQAAARRAVEYLERYLDGAGAADPARARGLLDRAGAVAR